MVLAWVIMNSVRFRNNPVAVFQNDRLIVVDRVNMGLQISVAKAGHVAYAAHQGASLF